MIDFGHLMAKDLAMRRGLRVRDVWFDATPIRNLRQIGCSVISCLWSSEAPLCWERLTERYLEARFGRARGCYSNASMSVADYYRASCYMMQRELKGWHDNPAPQQESPERISENTYCSTASRAFQAALKLAAMCCQKTRADLQSAFNLSLAEGSFVDDDVEEEEGNSFADSLQ